MRRIAQLTVLPLIGDMEYAFQDSLAHSKSPKTILVPGGLVVLKVR
jgi:hypothetical protein